MDHEGVADAELQLSSEALRALKEFYTERDVHEEQLEELRSGSEDVDSHKLPLSIDTFTEDWNHSQFWYSQDTATILADELLRNASGSTVIAIVSAPSVFIQIRNILNAGKLPLDQRPRLHLLEYDRRFAVFPEFIFYDFNAPWKLPVSLKAAADRIICDPPYLSENCQTKAALTVGWLKKPTERHSSPHGAPAQPPIPSRTIICTGERMHDLISKLYRSQGVRNTTFRPAHAKGLSNEFYCYANFECPAWQLEPRKAL